MSTKTLLTADDLERMPDDDSVRTELDEGELIIIPPAGFDHGDMGMEVALMLHEYVKKHKLGKILNADTGFRLRDNTVRAPEVAFFRAERIAALRGPGFAKGAPDLAVEIFFPSDSVRQLMRKVKQYFAAGCHTVWIFYQEREEIHVLEAGGADRILKRGDVLESPELLPGFSIPVAGFFK